MTRLQLFLSSLTAYLIFCFFEVVPELYDRFVRKKKILRLELDASDYCKLKSIVKHGDSGLKVDKWLQFHFKEDIKDYLEGKY